MISTDTTTTFVSHEGFQFTVKNEFVKKVDVTRWSTYELMSNYEMMKFLHNPNGPALVVLETGHKEYWLDGKKVEPETHERMAHTDEFNEKMKDLIKS